MKAMRSDQTEFEAFVSLANEWVEEDADLDLIVGLRAVRKRCRALLYSVTASLDQIVKACSDNELESQNKSPG